MDDPATSRPLPGAVPVLGRLVRAYRLVGVISGRPAAFLADHLAVAGLVRWGSYGLEEVAPDGSVTLAPEAEPWCPVIAAAVVRARRAAPPGVRIEDKGTSLTLHVRTAPEHWEWARDFAKTEAAATGLVEHDAKMSVELRPPLTTDKGAIVGRLVEAAGVRTACFVGDDLGDLSAFAALDAVGTAVRVAVRSDESPARLLAAADLIVDGTEGVLALLETLAG